MPDIQRLSERDNGRFAYLICSKYINNLKEFINAKGYFSVYQYTTDIKLSFYFINSCYKRFL